MARLIYIFVCFAIYQQTSAPNPPFKESTFCKCGTPNRRGRIVGGIEAVPNRYPWVAIIFKTYSIGIGLHCGGALINSKYVLTAGHCLQGFNKTQLLVYLGVHDIEEIKEKEVDPLEIESLIPHERYNLPTRTGDIGLIQLKDEIEPFEFHYICLPQINEDYTNKQGTVVGWGKIKEMGGVSEKLLEVNLTIISMDDCKNDDAVGSFVNPAMVCTVEEAKDACQGDSGGPLMILKNRTDDQKKGYYEEIGIVSFGYGCARPNVAAIFTRVAYYLDWIANKTQDAMYCMHPNKI